MDDMIAKIKNGMIKAKDGAQKITKVAIKKTSDVVSQTKLNYAVSEAENKIKQIKIELGTLLYEEYKNGAMFDGPALERCEKIELLQEEIGTLKEKIAELKNAVICPACNTYNKNDCVFCSKCGLRIREE